MSADQRGLTISKKSGFGRIQQADTKVSSLEMLCQAEYPVSVMIWHDAWCHYLSAWWSTVTSGVCLASG